MFWTGKKTGKVNASELASQIESLRVFRNCNNFIRRYKEKTYKESDNEVTWKKGLFCTRDYAPLVAIKTTQLVI